jgi:hypothetical protein
MQGARAAERRVETPPRTRAGRPVCARARRRSSKSPRGRACGEGPCFPVHHHAFQYCTCTVIPWCVSFQRRLCLSRVGFVNASLSFIPCPTVTRRFFLPFYKQPKNGSRASSYDEHSYLWALPFPLFSTPFFLPLFTFERAGGAGGSVLFWLLSHVPSCPGFHLRHMQHRCEKVSVRIGYVPFFTSVLFLSGLGVNIMKKERKRLFGGRTFAIQGKLNPRHMHGIPSPPLQPFP